MRWLGKTCLVGVGLLGLGVQGMASADTPAPRDTAGCRGVPEAEWDGSPLVNQSQIRSVQEIKSDTPVSEAETVVPRGGARILLRAEPGMTAEWLQRVANCHMMRVAAAPAWTLTTSPLDVKGARVSVQSAGDAFAVDITSPDVKVAKEIFTRARALQPSTMVR